MNESPPTIRLQRTTCGSGSVLLLLHGVTRCGADWEPLFPALAEDWTVIALDQRGHGGSPRGDRYLVTDYVADAVRLVREEAAGSVVIFGHSLGAMVAAAVAAECRIGCAASSSKTRRFTPWETASRAAPGRRSSLE